MSKNSNNNRYLPIAIKTANWLDQHIVETERGITWDISQSFKGTWRYYDEASMYAGASGIVKFYLELAQISGNQRYLETAVAAGFELADRALAPDTHLEKAFSPYAFTTGLSGVAQALDWINEVHHEALFDHAIINILNGIVTHQNQDGSWSGQIGIVADGGTALLLGRLGSKYQIENWQETLIKFGDYILAHKQTDENGQSFYVGLDLKFVGGPIGKFNTGFPLGPSGVAFTLLKLAELTGEERFVAGTKGIREFYEYYNHGQGLLLPHYHPDTEHICYVGYCGGPVGTARYFYQLAQQTGDADAKKDFESAIQGLDRVQAPAKRSAGYWETDNYCCGTAGILQLFTGAYIVTGRSEYLKKAQQTADILINRAAQDDQFAYWNQAFERKNPQNITAALGFYDGAAGIASYLLQLGEVENGHLFTHRFIDDPYPAMWQQA